MPPSLKQQEHTGIGLCMYVASRYHLETSCMHSSWKIADTFFSGLAPLTALKGDFRKCPTLERNFLVKLKELTSTWWLRQPKHD